MTITNSPAVTTKSSGYWYEHAYRPTAVDVLNLLRHYREEEKTMRAHIRSSMAMGETDLIALRYVMKCYKENLPVLQRDLAQLLRISSASTTILVDRLERSGHVRRVKHPQDRRATLIEPTVESDEEVRSTLDEMHQRMIAVTDGLSEAELETVATFLNDLINAIRTPSEHPSEKQETAAQSRG
ncbi:MarR family transcriptional regulator [Acaricomes phytoseiuli]|uniref:MarR family winged helix-turn-helix transcriptional regulator n=1 Tax=Acaricomes phytoseiuli TaxID=291968 RepID=UPI00037ADE9D|nr:MarR family transcriptional regulator [Acaricomes phytoseiuli]MCW1250474.1 MarR family transcriptional regulator [Acaricomes phytoseiuli]